MEIRLLTKVFCFALLVVIAEASSNENPLHEHLERRRRHVSRTLKSWRIQHAAKPKSRILPATKKSNPIARGFKLSFARPNKDRISRWFGVDESLNDGSNPVQLGMLQKQFNHDLAGMTNPLLHHERSGTDEYPCALPASTKATTTASASSNQQPAWWPSCFIDRREKKKWRVLIYRGTVGTGVECYKRVRDAALDWEFQDESGSVGLLNVPASNPNPQNSRIRRPFVVRRRYTVSPADDQGEPFHGSIGIGSARRMVSYAKSRFPLLPSLYAVNPVMAVYDLVDQRGPGTTFTSTAYATMKGHLLRGEERVTVALRDYDQSVDVEVVSFSRPAATTFARGLWPFVGKMQNKFFEQQMDFLRKVGRQCESEEQNRLSAFPIRREKSQADRDLLEYDF